MNRMKSILTATALTLTAASNALAAEPTKVYSSSILVLAFVGFLALVVAIQLIPAVMAVIGAFKAIMSKGDEKRVAEAKN